MSAVTFEHGPSFTARVARQRSVASRRTSPAPLHLTPRGRRVVTTLAIMVALVVGMLGGRAIASGPERGVEVDVYTVGVGETLWSIASGQSAPGQDVRDVVDELMSLNELSSSGLAAGQQLLLPVVSD